MAEKKYYEDLYDVVIIGGALAGCSAALVLAKKGLKVLVLEQHNIPGGVATSYVRGGEEFEASLHEMNAVGKDYEHQFVSEFFKRYNINVNFIEQEDCYRYVDEEFDLIVHHGTVNEKNEIDYTRPAKDIADAIGDPDGSIFKSVKQFCDLCTINVNTCDALTEKKLSSVKFKDLISTAKTSGYSAQDIMDACNMDERAQRIIGAYWNYMGTPLKDFPFTMFASLIHAYMGHSPHIPENYSYEMGLKLATAAEDAGAQIEYCQKVEKILVKDNKAYAVRTARGDVINARYVISGTYPNNTYRNMIEPESEVPRDAIKFVNSKQVGVSCFSVVILLDKSAEELGFKNYATFYNEKTLSVDEIWENGKTLGPYYYMTSVCQNMGNPKTSREGTCIFSSTILVDADAWENDVNADNYRDIIKMNADYIIDAESKRLGFNIRDHILEITYETPMTVARYSGAYKGSIYGYRHTIEDHVIARVMQEEKELFIKNLYFVGATTKIGDGMAPQFMSGESAALRILKKEGVK